MEGVLKSFEILKGVSTPKFKVVLEHKDLLKFRFPYYLKADVGEHKTDVGAVAKCEDLKHAERTLKWIHKKFPKNKIIVQENFEGIEMIVGVKKDESFGKILMVGFGGIFAEAKRDVSFRAFPVSREDIEEMVHELEGFKVFNSRGERHNLSKFYSLVEKVVKISEKKKISELDLNPVIVGEKESKAVDARVELK